MSSVSRRRWKLGYQAVVMLLCLGISWLTYPSDVSLFCWFLASLGFFFLMETTLSTAKRKVRYTLSGTLAGVLFTVILVLVWSS